MRDDPLNGNDELVRIAREYFARLTAVPVPRSLEDGTSVSTPSGRRSRTRRLNTSLALFVVVVAALSLAIVSLGHALTTHRSASVTPPPVSVATHPTATPPPGGPVPSVLKGVWREKNTVLSQPLTLTFYDGYSFELQISSGSFGGGISFGSVVVNGSEIDVFNGDTCAIPLPGGVGRYRWTLLNGVLHFTPLNQDPCPMRSLHIANQSFTK